MPARDPARIQLGWRERTECQRPEQRDHHSRSIHSQPLRADTTLRNHLGAEQTRLRLTASEKEHIAADRSVMQTSAELTKGGCAWTVYARAGLRSSPARDVGSAASTRSCSPRTAPR